MAAVVCLLTACSAQAVSINNINSPGYITSNDAYSGVVSLIFNEIGQQGEYLCTGALVAESYILTAGQCISGAANWQVTFQTASGTTTMGVSSSFLDPNFAAYPSNSNLAGLNKYDVGVLQLAGTAPSDAQVYSIQTDLSAIADGAEVTQVGYGLGGSADTGIDGPLVRRAADNIFNGPSSSLFGAQTPDMPLVLTLDYGPGTAGNYGLIAGGDSGAPLFYDNSIIGVGSFENQPVSGNYAPGMTYTAAFSNLGASGVPSFVGSYGVTVANVNADSLATPEPGTWALMAGALAGFAYFRRRRRTQVSETSHAA